LTETQREHGNSQARTIGIASAIWGVSIFLSRIMGLVREQIIGRTLGASREADLYFASFTLPDFLNYLLAAGALSIVFIPIFLGVSGGENPRVDGAVGLGPRRLAA
jgi:putative peptidoglycan lipid II flippase